MNIRLGTPGCIALLSGSLLSGVQSPNKLGTPAAAPMVTKAP